MHQLSFSSKKTNTTVGYIYWSFTIIIIINIKQNWSIFFQIDSIWFIMILSSSYTHTNKYQWDGERWKKNWIPMLFFTRSFNIFIDSNQYIDMYWKSYWKSRQIRYTWWCITYDYACPYTRCFRFDYSDK